MNVESRPVIEIAVLDDDRDFSGYIADSLSDEKCYNIWAFTTPVEFFESFQLREPHIVLLDLAMGEFRGEKVLESLLERWPKLCVIIVTGYPSLENMRATFKLKVFDYLSKPFSLAQLRHTLSNAIDSYGFGRSDADRLRYTLGHRVRVLRVERDWSLKDLADATHLSPSQISSIERGTHLPSIESLLAIARAFRLRPSQLLSSIDS